MTSAGYKIIGIQLTVPFFSQTFDDSTSLTVVVVNQYHHQEQLPVNQMKATIFAGLLELQVVDFTRVCAMTPKTIKVPAWQ